MYNSQSSTESVVDFFDYIDPRNLVARCGEAHFYFQDNGDLCFLTDGVKIFSDNS